MNARLKALLRTAAARYPAGGNGLKQAIKQTYLRFQPYDGPTLFPTRGPTRCGLVADIATAAGGSHTIAIDGSDYRFEVPPTDNPSLADFFAHHAHTQIPPVSISQIPGGRIYVNGVVLSPDGTTVARDLSLDFTAPFESHYLCDRPIHRSQPLKGRTLSVASWRTRSYYHWLLDELPRYLVPDLPPFDQIVCSRDSAINREVIHLLGLDPERIIFLNQVKHYQCDELIVPSYIATTGQPSSHLVDCLTQAVQPLISSPKPYPEKIFISRKSAGVRRIANEDAVFQSLESQGFTRIQLEKFSWQDQINLFYHAREIIAPHGAGLANLVFCAQKPFVMEIFNSNYIHWCFWQLATLVGANYVPLAFPETTKIQHDLSAGRLDINIGDSAHFTTLYQQIGHS